MPADTESGDLAALDLEQQAELAGFDIQEQIVILRATIGMR